MNPPENDPLDALLKDNDPYVEDAGFTARVMSDLPRRRRAPLRLAILWIAIILGFGLLAWWEPSISEIFAAGPDGSFAPDWNSLAELVPFVVAAGAVYWGLFALVKSER